jgi:hypothetical protein
LPGGATDSSGRLPRSRVIDRGTPAAARRSALPEALTSFIGRERGLAEIKRLLPGKRLLTLLWLDAPATCTVIASSSTACSTPPSSTSKLARLNRCPHRKLGHSSDHRRIRWQRTWALVPRCFGTRAKPADTSPTRVASPANSVVANPHATAAGTRSATRGATAGHAAKL